MGAFDVNKVVVRDDENHITRIGVEWAETRPAFDQLLAMLAAFGGIFGTIFILIGWLGSQPAWLLVGVMLAALVGGMWLHPRKRKALFLHADGRVETPFGTAYHPKPRAIARNFDNIESIEARPMKDRRQGQVHENLHEVVMLFRTGDLVVISHNLFEWMAIKVAMQLSTCRQELKRELLEIEMAPPPRPPVIDMSESDALIEELVRYWYGSPEQSAATSGSQVPAEGKGR